MGLGGTDWDTKAGGGASKIERNSGRLLGKQCAGEKAVEQ